MEREALMTHDEQGEQQQVKQQAGAAGAEAEGMPELTLKQALVGDTASLVSASHVQATVTGKMWHWRCQI